MHENLFEQVYSLVKLIPAGRVSTYGALAACLGTHARIVGWALRAAHLAEVPAHRVVNRYGLLTGKAYFGDGQTMGHLLQAEGIIIYNDQVQNFVQVFWDPLQELGFDDLGPWA